MKRNNILKGLGIIAMAGAMASCSSDYLDLQPEAQISNEEIATNGTAMRLVIYGLCESMYTQYSSLYDYRWFNGEPWLSVVYGDVEGQDYVSLFWQQSAPFMANWSTMNNDNSWPDFIPWVYCYTLINPANIVIAADTPDNPEIQGELAFRLAQAYTFRAHAYIRLQQIFGPSWNYSNNGQMESVIIRTEATNADTNPNVGLSTTNEVFDLIFSDLDRALELYDLSEYNRSYAWEPDKSVALGLYARAALLKTNDNSTDMWQIAYDKAKEAREGYTIMSRDDYKSGFADVTSESMWSSVSSAIGIYYASFGATYACNGAYPCLWGNVGAGAIDYTFYQKVQNPNDVRCDLFFTPDKVSRATRAQFWNTENCDPQTLDINIGEDLSPLVQEFALNLYQEVGGKGAGWKAPFNSLYFDQDTEGIKLDNVAIQFGAQFKFWGTDGYSASSFPFMRASEMLLIEAEAACHLGLDGEAQLALYELNSNRITGYNKSTKTGQALLDEVKLQRRIELWGEGFSWFDFKRWDEDIVRDEWEAGNPQSGNWGRALLNGGPVAQNGYLPKGFNNGWKWAVPKMESQYNEALMKKTNDTSL